MKRLLFIIGSIFLSGIASGQSPYSWTVRSQRTGPDSYILQVQGEIKKGWHLYAQTDTSQGISALQLNIDPAAGTLKSLKSLTKPITLIDQLFGDKKLMVYELTWTFSQQLQIKGAIPSSVKINLSGFASNDKEFLPVNENRGIPLDGGQAPDAAGKIKLSTVDLVHPLFSCGGETTAPSSWYTIFALGFLGGLLALLTPCVFPMIPLTVSWFMNQAGNHQLAVKKGVLYGFFIVFIYLLGSIPFHLLGTINPEIFNGLSTNIWVNLFFFVLFVIFALSFFGLFEFTISGKLTNSVDSKSGLATLGGIFFMALTLALVSFSCTGPILGTLLVGSLSSNGGAWQLTAGMGGFGLALALPFSLFAMFPGWMQKMPKSGGWLNTVKKVLAFAELAFAFKFLSNADLVAHWGILKREVFIGIWTLLSLLLGLYLIGVFRKRSDLNKRKMISKARISFGIAAIAFAVYLAQGITNTRHARFSLLSGFPPPLSYSIYRTNKSQETDGVKPRVINDYQAALKLARAEHKPILIDFTGWACVNCRKMEENVWTKPAVAAYMNKHFILVSLYVDDRKPLPASSRFTYKDQRGRSKDINTVGDQWATFESVNFAQVTQPLYVILNSEQKIMNRPPGLHPGCRCIPGLAAMRKQALTRHAQILRQRS